MRISVLTYNTADKQASLQSVHSIIQDNDSDIIFISLQEMYNLDSHFVIHKKGYTVSITKMIGMVSILLTKAHTKPKILKIGMGSFSFPNKGFILHSYNGTLFINCHLPAHEGNNEKRMAMIENILDIVSSIKDTKIIVVAGDMNFRVNGTKENRELLDDKEFDILKLKDECKEFKMKYGKFTEGDISFEPTYKFVIGSDQYDKKRFPSWCDRVFIASKYEKKSLAYKSLDVTHSDHRPVYAEYEIDNIIIDDSEILEHKKVNYLHKVILTHVYCFVYEQIYPILIVIIVFIALLTLKRIHKPIVNNT